MFLAHPACNKDIVRMKNDSGMTADMMVDEKSNKECAMLIREYLENNDRDEKSKLEELTLTEVAKRIEEVHDNEFIVKSKMRGEQKEELAELETEYKRKRDAILEKHHVDNKQFSSESETTLKALRQELEQRLSNSSSGASGSSTQPFSPSPTSLARKYHDVNAEKSNDGDDETKLENFTLTEVAAIIEEITANESLLKAKLRDIHKKELDKLNTAHRNKMSKLEADHRKELEKTITEYKKKRDITLENQAVENSDLCSESAKIKEILHRELEKRLSSQADDTSGPSSRSSSPASTASPPSPVSLLPSCPVCYETMEPPLQIFTCGNGHLICSSCKPEVSKCVCRARYMGRATAMEQMVRTILNIN